MLPEKSVLIGQKLIKITNFKYDILSGQKFVKMPKMVNLASFWKPESCGQTMLPDRSILKGSKISGKYKKIKFHILSNFQYKITNCPWVVWFYSRGSNYPIEGNNPVKNMSQIFDEYCAEVHNTTFRQNQV